MRATLTRALAALALSAGALALGPPVAAAEPAACHPPGKPRPPCGSDCLPDCRLRIAWTYGVSAGEPQHAALSAGLVFADVRQLGAPLRTARGLLLEGELGTGGAAVRAGPAVLLKLGFPQPNFLPVGGLALTATAVRAWEGRRDPETLLGGELLFTAVFRFRSGWLWPVDGGARRSRKARFTWGVGLGF